MAVQYDPLVLCRAEQLGVMWPTQNKGYYWLMALASYRVHPAVPKRCLKALGRIRHRSSDMVLVIDNQAVVSGLVSLQLGIRPRSIMMQWWDDINGMDIMAISVRKIAAHQRGPNKDCHWLCWIGNHLADKLAQQAFCCWPNIAAADRQLEGRVQGIKQLWQFAIPVGLAQVHGKSNCPAVPKVERRGRGKRQTGHRRGPARACSWPPW
eukprot:5227081-Amphidinium_carterae.1